MKTRTQIIKELKAMLEGIKEDGVEDAIEHLEENEE